jgi:hypothetical protein
MWALILIGLVALAALICAIVALCIGGKRGPRGARGKRGHTGESGGFFDLILTEEIVLTSSGFKTIGTIPLAVLAAPPTGGTFQFLGLGVSVTHPSGQAFTSGGNIELKWDAQAANFTTFPGTQAFIDSTSPVEGVFTATQTPPANQTLGSVVNITTAGGVNFTGNSNNDNVVTLRLIYTIVPIP